MSPQNRAVFLDRDETLNKDPGYISQPAQVELYPGVAQGLYRLKDAGFLLIVVSNQSGVARGHITWDQLKSVNDRLNELLILEAKVKIDHFEICPHHPHDFCECRKPKPLLITAAAKKYDIDVARSYMIGDRDTDLDAGRAAGCAQVFQIDHKNPEAFTIIVNNILEKIPKT